MSRVAGKMEVFKNARGSCFQGIFKTSNKTGRGRQPASNPARVKAPDNYANLQMKP